MVRASLEPCLGQFLGPGWSGSQAQIGAVPGLWLDWFSGPVWSGSWVEAKVVLRPWLEQFLGCGLSGSRDLVRGVLEPWSVLTGLLLHVGERMQRNCSYLYWFVILG